MRREKAVARTLPTSKKPRESKLRMKKRKTQKRRKVGLGHAQPWVLSPRPQRRICIGYWEERADSGPAFCLVLPQLPEVAGLTKERNSICHLHWLIESPAKLRSQGHAWAPRGQECGSHIPPKPFSQHFTPVSQGAASAHQVQALAGWETGLTCLFSTGLSGRAWDGLFSLLYVQ